MRQLLTVFSILLLATLFSVQSFAQSKAEIERRLMVEDSYEASYGQLFNEAAYFRGDTFLNEYTNVIVINKAANKQTLRLYTNRQLMLSTKVSTGREDVEHIGAVRGVFNKIFKGTTQSHWRHTTRGFYTIKRVEGYNYRSGESKFHMPYAMFFNDRRGLAVHQVPPDLSGGEAAGEYALGSRASSGCVRVHKNYIQQIHTAVLAADKGQIPVLSTKTGQAQLDEYGRVRYERGYKTIVIVEEY
ncbi:L,D-transpeptidase [Bdellovibrio sp. HCB-110]|uniref:L,D-transpeptidase n=1 Tax=Bdellovibrio sp. HCB-110 TaxID=3391182 RepID=UPI0039B63A42